MRDCPRKGRAANHSRSNRFEVRFRLRPGRIGFEGSAPPIESPVRESAAAARAAAWAVLMLNDDLDFAIVIDRETGEVVGDPARVGNADE